LKKDVKTTEYGLKEVLKLRPVNYTWKDNDRKDLGFIAQEIREILPEIVLESDDEMKTLLMNYNGVIPVLVKAIQEQQKIIQNQNTAIEQLKAENKDIQELKTAITEKLKELNDLQKQIENKTDSKTEISFNQK
jgi:DNA-binding transcriptional regulator GbsR (MarR family)